VSEYGGAAADVTNLRVPGLVPLHRRASEPSGGAALLTLPASAGEEAA
jgi:hypothetical protein